MREWSLGPGDPLALTLAADFRFCTLDYMNDQIWELETGKGDPPALSLYTTYGLRARRMRIFPRFSLGSQAVVDPAAFSLPPRLRRFFPNFLWVEFSPFADVEVTAEYWAPDSHSVAGRFTVTNHGGETKNLVLELCGQLTPHEGQSLAPLSIQSVNLLAGVCGNIAPVIFMTGGPHSGPGPFCSLALELSLSAGGSRILTWAQAALADSSESFEYARRMAARQWEAERAKIEMINESQSLDIYTGDPDWDAAFALSQKTAFGLIFGSSQHLPNSSFVLARQPDQGFSPRGDGSDHTQLWNGQSIWDAAWLGGQHPGSPGFAAGLVHNFLAGQSATGEVDGNPGLAGQRGHWLAAPLLANFAWETFLRTRDLGFLQEIQPGLEAFINCWLDSSHDRDGDGFTEWDLPIQTGLEDYAAFNIWQECDQGADITTSESPALAALLSRETHALAKIAEILGQPEKCNNWEMESGRYSRLAEECWDIESTGYHLRDRDSHLCPVWKSLGIRRGTGGIIVRRKFKQPVRILVRIEMAGEAIRNPEITLSGKENDIRHAESLERKDFQWGTGMAVATTRFVYNQMDEILISGLEKQDRVSVSIMDFSAEDISLFLPLWAGIPDASRAGDLVRRTILSNDRFGGKFGIPDHPLNLVSANSNKKSTSEVSTILSSKQATPLSNPVRMPWNTLIGEGMLRYDLRQEASDLTTRLMSGIIQNLKREHAFASAYQAASGDAIGKRNHVQGLAPLALFLETLGVRIESTPGIPGSSHRVFLSGKNPFLWPVTVKYRGLTITRRNEETDVSFPDGQVVKLSDPTDAVVSLVPAPLRDTG
jgi:hypothetical protein